jgi:hypothetical protein
MNSTPGPVIFLLIVVPGRAIPSFNLNSIQWKHGMFCGSTLCKGKGMRKTNLF